MRMVFVLLVAFCVANPAKSQELSLSNAERIYGLSLIWSEVKRSFVHYDAIRFDWDSLYLSTIDRVSTTTDTYEYYTILRRMVASLRDGHTKVSLPADLRRRHERNFPLRTRLIEDRVIVTEVLNDSLVAIGLRAGMEILAIDGIEVHEYARTRVMPNEASSTPQDLALRAYSYDLWLGPAATPVRITARDQGGNVLRTQASRMLRWNRVQPKPVIDFRVVGDNVGLLTLNSFGSRSFYAAFDSLYPAIRDTRGLIIDIRANDGGSSSYGYYVVGHLVDRPFYGTSWYTRQHLAKLQAGSPGVEYYLHRRELHQPQEVETYGGPVVLLIGAATFSAAEDFAATVDYLDVGTLIGTPTGGSSGEPILRDLPGGGRVRIVTEHDFYPDGRQFVGVGVLPDIDVHQTVAAVREGRDLVLERAIAQIGRR